MQFSVGSQFSRELTPEEGRITYNLSNELNDYFVDRDYGAGVKKIYVGVICVSKGFEPFFPIRPLKIIRNKLALEYEIKIDFKLFSSSGHESRKRILVNEFLKKTKDYLKGKTIKDFDKERFIDDLEHYFNNNLY